MLVPAMLLIIWVSEPDASTPKSSSETIYFPSQKAADLAMAAFDDVNPDCELWTNWQKMCSRTGENGAVLCHKSTIGVRPSTPFCAARTNGPFEGLSRPNQPTQFTSYMRFCRVNGKVPAGLKDFEHCVWTKNRPFNGLSRSDRRHPWCKRWVPAVPKAINAQQSKAMGLYCSDSVVPDWCQWPEGMAYGRNANSNTKIISDQPRIMTLFDPSSRAINGLYCRRKANHAR
jgi:hypothetical protein